MIFSTKKIKDQKDTNKRRGGVYNEFYIAIESTFTLNPDFSATITVNDYIVRANEDKTDVSLSLYFNKTLTISKEEVDTFKEYTLAEIPYLLEMQTKLKSGETSVWGLSTEDFCTKDEFIKNILPTYD